MTKMCQFPALRTLILGATMAGGLAGLTAQSQAMMTADEFLASISEMKRICRYIDEPFITKKYNYGCGKYECKKGKCYTHKRRKPRRPNDPPVLTHVPGTAVLVESKSDGNNGRSDGRNEGGQDGGQGPNNGPNSHSGPPR